MQVPLPPLPTLFESNTPFPEVQKVLDAFDDYLAYRYVASLPSLVLIITSITRSSGDAQC